MKVSISNTFKRVAFTLVSVFLVAVIANWLLNTVIENENTAMWISVGIGFGAGVLAYTKFNDWLGEKE